jgi:YidC/Oxa1 family membrane protein insertase
MGMRLVQKKPQTAGQMILHEGIVGMTEGSLREVTYAKLSKQKFAPTYLLNRKPEGPNGLGGWLGLTDKYWLVAVLAQQDSLLTARASMLSDSWIELSAQGASVSVKPGEMKSQALSMYLGPKRLSVLENVGTDLHVDRLHMAVDFGWFYFLTKPMLTFLTWLKDGLGNFGLAILVMTIGIKGLLFPLSARAFRSMSRMKQLQPKLAALKLKYAQDKIKMNQATIELYKSESINPLAGLWPMLIQIPIFFSLYKVLFISIEMRHAPFWGWVHDLSAADPTSLWNGFGLLPWSAPSWLPIGLWPVLMGFTMVGQQRLSGAVVADRQQKIMLTYVMPGLFAFMLAQFPVGLVIYWTWNNLLTMGQQWFMMRYYSRES